MSEPWKHFYQSQRLKLAYWTWGEADKPPLILIHGGRDHARSWDYVAQEFRDDYQVIAVDLRGHGDSEWATGSSYSLPEHVPDLVALIDLFGGRASVVGHSFGGAITLLTAGTFPERFERIVALEGAGARIRPEAEELTPERLREWALRMRSFEQRTPRVYPTIEESRDRMVEANQRLSPDLGMHLARWGSEGIDGGYVWKFDPWVRGHYPVDIAFDDMKRIWANIDAPILHLLGEESHFAKFQKSGDLDGLFKRSRTVVVPKAGHWIHHDALERTVSEIRAFLDEGATAGREDAVAG